MGTGERENGEAERDMERDGGRERGRSSQKVLTECFLNE